MAERGGGGEGGYFPLPEPEDVFRGIERELGIPVNKELDWNDWNDWNNENNGSGAPVGEQLFEGEAPTYFQRRLAQSVLHNFYFFQSRPPSVPSEPGETGEPGEAGEEPATVEDLLETFYSVQEEQRAGWNDPDPFPDITLEHVLGATKRHIAWLQEQRAFEETGSYDRSIQEYYAIHSLIEGALATERAGQEGQEAEDVTQPLEADEVDRAEVIGGIRNARNTAAPHGPIIERDSPEKRVERLVAAIEDDIRAGSPHLGERFPLYLPSPTHKLLQGEADTELGRALSFLCSDAMLRLVDQHRRRTQADPASQASQIPPLNERDIEDYFTEYLQNEPANYTLANVLAATKRRLLSRHLGRDRRLSVVDRDIYKDTILVHDLLSKALFL